MGLHSDHTSPRNICGIGDFKAHIFSPKTTQELPKKHHEAGQPEKKSITDTLDTMKFTRRFACAKGTLENLSRS